MEELLPVRSNLRHLVVLFVLPFLLDIVYPAATSPSPPQLQRQNSPDGEKVISGISLEGLRGQSYSTSAGQTPHSSVSISWDARKDLQGVSASTEEAEVSNDQTELLISDDVSKNGAAVDSMHGITTSAQEGKAGDSLSDLGQKEFDPFRHGPVVLSYRARIAPSGLKNTRSTTRQIVVAEDSAVGLPRKISNGITDDDAAGRGAAWQHNETLLNMKETEHRKNAMTADQWITAVEYASLNPVEAAAAAASLPIVRLSEKEQMLVLPLLRRQGLYHLAAYFQGDTQASENDAGRRPGEETEDFKRRTYDAAVEELEAYKAANPHPIESGRLPLILSYDEISAQERELIQRVATEIILLRIRDALVAHAGSRYEQQQERLRQGLPPEPHPLLEIIENIKQGPDVVSAGGVQSAMRQFGIPTRTSEHGRPTGRLTPWQEVTPRYAHQAGAALRASAGNESSPLERKHSYYIKHRPQNKPPEANAGESPQTGRHADSLQKSNEVPIAATPGKDVISQMLQSHGSRKSGLLLENLAGYEDAVREDVPLEEMYKTEDSWRSGSGSSNLWKDVVLAGNPYAAAVLRYFAEEKQRLPRGAQSEDGRPLTSPGTVLPPELEMLRHETANQWRNAPLGAFAQLHPPVQELLGKLTLNGDYQAAASTLQGRTAESNGPTLQTTQIESIDSQGERQPGHKDLQMQSTADTPKNQVSEPSAENRHLARSLRQAPTLDEQSPGKRQQTNLFDSLEQVIASRPKAELLSLGTVTAVQETPKAQVQHLEFTLPSQIPSLTLSTLELDPEHVILHSNSHGEYERQRSSGPAGYEAAALSEAVNSSVDKEEEEEEMANEEGPEEEVKKHILETPYSEVVQVPQAGVTIAPVVVAEMGAELHSGVEAAPMLLLLQSNRPPLAYDRERDASQVSPDVGSNHPAGSSPEPAPEYQPRQSEIHESLPLQGDIEAEPAAVSLGLSPLENDVADILSAALPVWAARFYRANYPRKEATATVAAGHVSSTASVSPAPFGSPSPSSHLFGGAGQTTVGMMYTVPGWQFSPPTSTALQTLPARGMFAKDTDGSGHERRYEAPNTWAPGSIYLDESAVEFMSTPLPHFSPFIPQQQLPFTQSPSPTSTPVPAETVAHVGTSAVTKVRPSFTQPLTAAAWQQRPPYGFTPDEDGDLAPHVETGISLQQVSAITAAEISAVAPLLPLATTPPGAPAYLAPIHENEGIPIGADTQEAYEADEPVDEQEATSAGGRMRGSAATGALTAIVDGSARQAVQAAASTLPQLVNSAEEIISTTSALVNAGSALAKSLPIEEAAQLGQHLNELRMRRKEGPPLPTVGEPSVRCMSSGVICCVPQKAVGPEWRKKPPYLNDSSPSNRVCQAHFVPLQDAVCAATEYNDKECGIERIETSSMIVFKHTLHVRGPKRLTAICECHWKRSKERDGAEDGADTLLPHKAPGQTVESVAQWHYSKKAMIEGRAARLRTEKFLSGLGAALKATELLTEHASTDGETSAASTEHGAAVPADNSKRLLSGVSALADVLLEQKASSPSAKYVKQALADIARVTNGD